MNFVQLTVFNDEGKQTFRCSWVSDLEITETNVEKLIRGARSRWKIENEGFNTLRNHGYHLEHNFGHGKHYPSEAFFVLNLWAFFMHLILVHRPGGALERDPRNLSDPSLRFLGNEVLERMNAPPQQAFR